jgi:hypothetical protein
VLLGLLCLLLTGVLATACDDVAAIGQESQAWKTYRSPAHGYEIDYPREWEAVVRAPERVGEVFTRTVEFHGITERRDGAYTEESLRVVVNYEGGWCEGAAAIEVREVLVDGETGFEHLCYRASGACLPTPNCYSQPYGLVLQFVGVRGQTNLTVISEPTADFLLIRRMLESFRFVE